MNEHFREVTSFDEWRSLGAVQSPFLEETWEHALAHAFPYIHVRHFIYHETHAVRLVQIGGRMTSLPFSDGGDVVALTDATLSLDMFRSDLIEQFGDGVMVRVNEYAAPVVQPIEADIVDFRIALPSFGLESVRKTLRHIIEKDLPDDAEIRKMLPSDADRIYRLYLLTMHGAGGIALSREAFEQVLHNDVFVFVRRGVIEAASAFLTDETTIHHFINASSGRGKEEHAPHHLLFHAIQHYQEAGKLSLFLGGTNASSSLRTFKEGWRGEECRVFTVSGTSARESARRSPLRMLWKLIPASLLPKATKLVGKHIF